MRRLIRLSVLGQPLKLVNELCMSSSWEAEKPKQKKNKKHNKRRDAKIQSQRQQNKYRE